ncbi:MAG TPA: signal recognition particle protein [Dongiaceae bacterium]|nr:signal recognition particle protein [Dongiaceae bacterium]
MFEKLSERLGETLRKLTGRGVLTAAHIEEALREVRISLLEADVALPVVKDLLERIQAEAVGEKVLRSITPGQLVIKIVHDELVRLLSPAEGQQADLNFNAQPPVPLLLVGLQGSGKTTTTAKLAKRLHDRSNKKIMMASLDTRRPAAQQQLAVLGEQIGVRVLPIVPGEPPVSIAKRAMQMGRLEGFDVVLLDSAGRLSIDEEMMEEAAAIAQAVNPRETLLVVDALTGQDAVQTATAFRARVQLTGIVLTRLDGDARGGAALSMRAVAQVPIKFMGVGEKLDQLEEFHADRIAGRILGQGDIVGLVERAMENVAEQEAQELAQKIQRGQFNLEDMASQLRQLQKMGGLSGLMGFLPGLNKMQKQIEGKIDDSLIKRQLAIISSMTHDERRRPDIIKASRKQRIARGAGVDLPMVNKLLKQHMEMARMVKQVNKLGQKGLARHGLGALLKNQGGFR